MAPGPWYRRAVGDYGPDALSERPALDAPASLRGYDVVVERAGTGLVLNPWRDDGTVTAGLAMLWHGAPPTFGMIRTIPTAEWRRGEDAWISAASALADARMRGWAVTPVDGRYADDANVGFLVAHPLSNHVVCTVPHVARHLFDARTLAHLRALRERLDGLGSLGDHSPDAEQLVLDARRRAAAVSADGRGLSQGSPTAESSRPVVGVRIDSSR